MKKLQCLVYHRDYEDFLETLRELGVVHVEANNVDDKQNAELRGRIEQVKRIERIVAQLHGISNDTQKVAMPQVGNPQHGREVAKRVEQINERINELNSTIKNATTQIEALSPWGDFAPACLSLLSEAGREIHFYTVPNKAVDESWFTDTDAIIINRDKKDTWFISIVPSDESSTEATRYAGATEVHLPQIALHEAYDTLRAAQSELPQLHTELQVISTQYITDIEAAAHEERAGMTFRHVVLGTEKAAEDTLMILTGWMPAASEKSVAEALERSKAWYSISMPTRNDRIPTAMRNNRITRLYEVLTNMYGTPDYDEFDSTPMIAIFFSLFFGFCVGDAGYGIILLLFGFPICRFLSNGLQLHINPVLVTVLGFASTVVGLILGTAFGVNLAELDASSITGLGWIKELQPYMISGKLPGTNYDCQMVLALAIGVLHICIAMFVKALGNTIRYGFRIALVDWSWWLLIIACVSGAMLMLLTSIPTETLRYILMAVGIICGIGIYLLNDPNRNVGLNIGAGLWATYNMATGLMGDVLSYIRLYALGLAGGMLGGVFNQLATQVGSTSERFGWIFMLAILILGHTLNIAMSCLSAFVHPLRLTFVEYFKNSGYSGKGVAYRPFTK